MRFEHIIEINSPQRTVQMVVPRFTRAQLWLGLMMRVQTPQRFPNGPESCDWQETAPGLFVRTLRFGQHVMEDEVQTLAQQSLRFTPQQHGDTAPIRLTITIEEPQPQQMVLRFLYVALGEQSAEEAYYNEYRQSAWLHHDRDMVKSLREWLDAGEFEPLNH